MSGQARPKGGYAGDEVEMNVSAIYVVSQPNRLAACVEAIETVPGFSVYHKDPERPRLVAIQEAPTIEAEMEGLRRIQSLPGVIAAELVYHYFEDAGRARQECDQADQGTTAVPEWLNR